MIRLMTAKPDWIWQRPNWPSLTYDAQLRSHGAGKAVRYYVNVPEWTHGLIERI